MRGKYFLLILSAFLVATVTSNKTEKVTPKSILFIHLIGTSSHRISIWPLAEELANRGHNITYISPLTKNRIGSHPKVTEIIPSKLTPLLNKMISKVDITIRIDKRQREWFVHVTRIRYKFCEAFYNSPEIKEWLQQPNLHFDLIMIDTALGECAFGLVHKFKAKMIQFTPQAILPYMFDGFGISPESSTLPNVITNTKPSEMTFLNRVSSTLIPIAFRIGMESYFENLRGVISKGINITDLPHLQEIGENTSLVLVNNYLIEDYPMALPPTFVSFSGLWCSKEKLKGRKSLPYNIANFIGKSKGFFYISFGSAVEASTMPVWMRNHFFTAFKRMPEYSFLWRWTGTVPDDTPENALLLSWFPQHDVLAHHKIKGFMTQGGQPSVQEALCHAVPLIVSPIFGDQDYTAMRLEQIGAALLLDMAEINENTLMQNFKQLVENKTHVERFKELAEQYMDRPLDPLENVVFWTEYVLRRDTSLLRPLGIKQSWWERRLLDVYLFLLIVLLITFATVFYIFKIFLRFILDKLAGNIKIKAN